MLPHVPENDTCPKPAEVVTLSSQVDGHSHSYSQIVIGLQGRVEFDINGFGNLINPGQGCIISECADHEFGGVGKESDILVLNLVTDDVYGASVLDKIHDLKRDDCYFQLDVKIRQLIHMLVFEMQSHPNDLLLSRGCNDTLIALLKTHIKTIEADTKGYRFDLAVIDRYIDTHISKKMSIAQLAGSVFLSESQFHHLFKAQVGITPHQYVLTKRIALAKSLIEQGRYSLAHVADLTGFASHSAFTHAFTRLQGVSPMQFKKRYLR
jgi:AraC-like DNA-binding protein